MAEKRPRGAPRKPDSEKPITVHTTLPPAVHAAWKADGRPLNELVKVALEL